MNLNWSWSLEDYYYELKQIENDKIKVGKYKGQ